MPIALFALLFTWPGLAPARPSDDCVECGRLRHEAPLNTNFIEDIAAHVNGLPGSPPAKTRLASVYGGHKIETMTPGYPWNSVGRLFLPASGMKFCTAVRVSACHILTNAHCVVQPGKHGESDPAKRYEQNITYVPPFSRNLEIADQVLAPKGDPETNRGADWAILRLPGSKGGTEDGWLGICPRTGEALKGKTYTLAAFNSELSPRAKEAFLDRKTEVIRAGKGFSSGNENVIYFRGNLHQGGSGAPILEFDEKGQACVTALAAAGPVDENNNGLFLNADETKYLAEGVASAAFLDKARKFMQDYPCP